MMDNGDDTVEEAWAIYRFRHPDVDASDAKLSLLSRYIEKRRGAGEHDSEELIAQGLALLRRIDRHGDLDLN